MRTELKKINGDRRTFTGTFVRLGTKSSYGYVKQTLLLADVKDSSGNVVTDHLWFNLTKGFESLNLVPGDIVQFDARVKPYMKGYRGWRDEDDDYEYKPVSVDYKLSNPSKVKRIDNG